MMTQRVFHESVYNAYRIATVSLTGQPSHQVLCSLMPWCRPLCWTAIGFMVAESAASLATSVSPLLFLVAAPMPAGVLEQFPEPRIIELVPPAHQQHPPPAIMAGFDFAGFELPEELQSDEESDLSSEESDGTDSALEDSPSLSDSDSDSVSSRW
ncbi:MIOREX complex component 2 [Frankliniella fusca]|uniref:MIOREX complex component 2 n=1 Tax=Frankliniella fusca TaxID=407009 RepID=A0AAE1HK40_9NEOP|nr:MIOREX complex component 2 [Frankliniella fusca]